MSETQATQAEVNASIAAGVVPVAEKQTREVFKDILQPLGRNWRSAADQEFGAMLKLLDGTYLTVMGNPPGTGGMVQQEPATNANIGRKWLLTPQWIKWFAGKKIKIGSNARYPFNPVLKVAVYPEIDWDLDVPDTNNALSHISKFSSICGYALREGVLPSVILGRHNNSIKETLARFSELDNADKTRERAETTKKKTEEAAARAAKAKADREAAAERAKQQREAATAASADRRKLEKEATEAQKEQERLEKEAAAADKARREAEFRADAARRAREEAEKIRNERLAKAKAAEQEAAKLADQASKSAAQIAAEEKEAAERERAAEALRREAQTEITRLSEKRETIEKHKKFAGKELKLDLKKDRMAALEGMEGGRVALILRPYFNEWIIENVIQLNQKIVTMPKAAKSKVKVKSSDKPATPVADKAATH